MWWSQEEEDLQKRYIAAWGEAADDDLADLAADFADLDADPPDPPDGDLDLGGEAEAAEGGGPPCRVPVAPSGGGAASRTGS
jgi:hypothetical protein